MKVTAFSGTPRKGGNSDILADKILEGAAAAGATVEKVRLHGLRISPCAACGACQRSFEAPCVQDDDMAPLLAKLRASDAVVLACPIYFFSACAQMKTFLDRTYALGGGGRWDALSGKRAAAAFSYADADVVASGVFNAVGMVRDACSFLAMELRGIVHASCGEAGEVLRNETALRDAEELGKRLVS